MEQLTSQVQTGNQLIIIGQAYLVAEMVLNTIRYKANTAPMTRKSNVITRRTERLKLADR